MRENRLRSHRVRLAEFSFAVLSIVAAPKLAHADEEASRILDFAVDAGVDGCSDAQSFAESVASHLGYDPFSPTGKGAVRARVHGSGSRLTGTVDLVDEHGVLVGSKSLTSSTCESLMSAMSFAVGMAIDPASTMRPKEKPKLAPSAPVSSPQTEHEEDPFAKPTITETPQKQAPPAHHHLEPQIAVAGGVAGFGPAAGVAAALYADIGARYGAASLELEGRYFLPSSQTVVGNASVKTSAIGASLVPCAHVSVTFFCAQIFLGALQGQAEGIQNQQGGTTFFSQAGIRAGIAIPVSHVFRLEPFVDGLVTLTPTTLKFLSVDVWSASPLGIDGGIRIAVSIP